MAYAPQIYNPGSRGQNARYDVRGLSQVAPGVYSDGTYQYDANGLSLNRPDSVVSGLKPADQMDGDQWGAYLSGGGNRSGGPSGPGGFGGFDYQYDPILQEFNLQAARDEQGARANLVEQQRRRLIALGSKSVAEKILGAEDPTLAGVSSEANATSQLGRIFKQYLDYLRDVDVGTSESNTFFGSGRATGYQDAAYGRQQAEFDAISGAETDLQGYQDALQQFLRQLMAERRSAEMDAWMRQMWQNLLNQNAGDPYDPPPEQGQGDGSIRLQTLAPQFIPPGYFDPIETGRPVPRAGGGGPVQYM